MTKKKITSFLLKNHPDLDLKSIYNKKYYRITLSILILFILLIINIILYFNMSLKISLQTKIYQKTNQQLSYFEDQLVNINDLLKKNIESQDKNIKQLEIIYEKIELFFNKDPKLLLLMQANDLIQLAIYKLYNQEDVTIAEKLLKIADSKLEKINDTNVINVRHILNQDINLLSAIKKVNSNNILFRMRQLSEELDQLYLFNQNKHGVIADIENDKGKSYPLYQENHNSTMKNWFKFLDDFITIRHRNSTSLLQYKQEMYIYENIHFYLLIASQAILYHQNKIYQLSINNIYNLINIGYDINNDSIKKILNHLNELKNQDISVEIPDILKIQVLIEKLIQNQMNNSLPQKPIDNQ